MKIRFLNEPIDDKEYAYDNSARNVMTDGEKQVVQSFVFVISCPFGAVFLDGGNRKRKNT